MKSEENLHKNLNNNNKIFCASELKLETQEIDNSEFFKRDINSSPESQNRSISSSSLALTSSSTSTLISVKTPLNKNQSLIDFSMKLSNSSNMIRNMNRPVNTSNQTNRTKSSSSNDLNTFNHRHFNSNYLMDSSMTLNEQCEYSNNQNAQLTNAHIYNSDHRLIKPRPQSQEAIIEECKNSLNELIKASRWTGLSACTKIQDNIKLEQIVVPQSLSPSPISSVSNSPDSSINFQTNLDDSQSNFKMNHDSKSQQGVISFPSQGFNKKNEYKTINPFNSSQCQMYSVEDYDNVSINNNNNNNNLKMYNLNGSFDYLNNSNNYYTKIAKMKKSNTFMNESFLSDSINNKQSTNDLNLSTSYVNCVHLKLVNNDCVKQLNSFNPNCKIH